MDVNKLLRSADMSMYHAKANGRNNFQAFTEELNYATTKRMTLENSLRSALENNEFLLVYQPLVDITKKVCHFWRGGVNSLETS